MITEIPKIGLILFSVPLAVFGLRRSFVDSLRKRMHALDAGLLSGGTFGIEAGFALF